MKTTPSLAPSTTSPGITMASPTLIGMLIPTTLTSSTAEGCASLKNTCVSNSRIPSTSRMFPSITAPVRVLPENRGMEVIASERVTRSSTHQIDHRHITPLQQINYLLVLSAGHLLCLGLRSQDVLQVRPERKILCSNCAAHKRLSWMKHLEVGA